VPGRRSAVHTNLRLLRSTATRTRQVKSACQVHGGVQTVIHPIRSKYHRRKCFRRVFAPQTVTKNLWYSW